MKVNPGKLVKYLETVSMKWEIPYIQMQFKSDAGYVGQVDPSNIIAVISKLHPSFFKEYGDVESIIISKDEVKYLKENFRASVEIDIRVQDTNVLMVDEKSGRIFSYGMPDEDIVRSILGKIKDIQTTPYGYLFPKSNVKRAYKIDSGELNLYLPERSIRFKYGDTLQIIQHSEIRKFETGLRVLSKEGNDSGEVSIQTDFLEKIIDVIGGHIWIVFTDGPIHITHTTPEYTVTYVVAPVVE